MKKLSRIFSQDNLWVELSVATLVVIAFATVGYFSREFALDLQANFFAIGEWNFL